MGKGAHRWHSWHYPKLIGRFDLLLSSFSSTCRLTSLLGCSRSVWRWRATSLRDPPATCPAGPCYRHRFMSPPASSFPLPLDYARFRRVHSLDELVTTPFADGVHALCWPRTLPGDFRAVLAALGPGEGIVTVDLDDLADLSLSEAGKLARDLLLADQQTLRAHGLQPSLDRVHGSEREAPEGLFHTDVSSFHVDTATVPADTYLCTYVGATSEALRHEETVRRVDLPATRAELLALYGGPDDAGFIGYLSENFYDLHYVPLPGAHPFSFGLGNLWRIAIDYPGSPVPPCVHRAPLTLPGQAPRLLLIS